MKWLNIFLVYIFALISCSGWADSDELLEPEEAFQFTAEIKDANTVTAHWQIADGYYMYRSRFLFKSESNGIQLGQPIFPNGKIKHDDYFGEVEIYRQQISVAIPIKKLADTGVLALKVIYQGCADLGVCYTPITQRVNLKLPTTRTNAKQPNLINQLSQLTGVANAGDDEFLDPDIAFQVTAEQGDTDNIITHWSVVDGYYLYKDKISVLPADDAQITLGAMDLPAGEEKHDEYFGEIVSIDHGFDSKLPIQNIAANVSVVELIVSYQGCAKAGLCYPPITKNISVALNYPGSAGALSSSENNNSAGGSNFQSEQDRIANTLAAEKLWFTVISFFGLGLLLAFTPCVFPMIPILSSIIVGQGETISTSKAFTLSLVYVLAMAVTYTLAGVMVGLSGQNIQVWFQNPWVISVFAGIFVLLSLAMFGYYELQMPNSIQTRLNAISSSQERGSYVSTGIMGFLSALIIGPCVTAPLIGALIYIAETGDALIGGIALFALSMGMGAPLLAIGTSAGKVLPTAGAWMDTVKAVFGILLLAMAIWMLERILPKPWILTLAGALLVFAAVYLGTFKPLGQSKSGFTWAWRTLGIATFIYGGLLLVGAIEGSHKLTFPVQFVKNPQLALQQTKHAHHGIAFKQVKGLEGLQAAIKQAKSDSNPVMLDFYADWCISCKEMEALTFTNNAVQISLENFVLLQTDVTDNDEQDQKLLKELGLFGPPAIVFYDHAGNEQRNYRVVGFMNAQKFASHVENFKRSSAVALNN